MTPSQQKFAFREQNNKETVQGNDLGIALSKAQFDLREVFVCFCFCPRGLFCTCEYFSQGRQRSWQQHSAPGHGAPGSSPVHLWQQGSADFQIPSTSSVPRLLNPPVMCRVSLYIHTSFSDLHTCSRSHEIFLQSCWLWWPWPYYQGHMGVGKNKERKEIMNTAVFTVCMLFVSIRWVSPCLLFKDFVSLPLKNSSACM